jgi:hypothetical protein
MMKDERFPADDDEGRLLLAVLEDSHARHDIVAEQLRNPRQSLLYPAYQRLENVPEALRVKCDDARSALWAHRKRILAHIR